MQETSMKLAAIKSACCLLRIGFFLGIFFNLEDGDSMFLQSAR
jgi:hypothetical protein